MSPPEVVLILHTTLYREGGSDFARAARSLAAEKGAAEGADGPRREVIVRAVESRREVRALLLDLQAFGRRIAELHFIGHSGMYGPMFGTVAFPEQFSPYEWENLAIPFAPGAVAAFHCCRSARWFAPFFARTFGVPTGGFFWYTTFSASREWYRRPRRGAGSGVAPAEEPPLHVIGCKGRKSHGLLASARKRAGLMPAERMRLFDPAPPAGETTYERVAAAYDAAFADIKVRADEWRWIRARLEEARAEREEGGGAGGLRVLDVGCGNGALLRELAPYIASGAGVDESAAMLARARERNVDRPHLEFARVGTPALPFPDDSFDLVISLLSFRYLDWDPLMAEIRRVCRPGARLLVVDMVAAPVAPREVPRFLAERLRGEVRRRFADRSFHRNLARLVSLPEWKTMLRYNPIRAEHEMRWYLESRFPGRKVETLNLGWHARTLAFDSGPVERGVEVRLTYP